MATNYLDMFRNMDKQKKLDLIKGVTSGNIQTSLGKRTREIQNAMDAGTYRSSTTDSKFYDPNQARGTFDTTQNTQNPYISSNQENMAKGMLANGNERGTPLAEQTSFETKSIDTQVGTGVSTNTGGSTNTGNVNYWEENQRRIADDEEAKAQREAKAKADAQVQAEAEALARQNAYNQSLRRNVAMRDQALRGIDSAFRESAQGLDNDYFQRYLMNQQQQVANGLNAGIAGDMDTRLSMARQGDLANIYRDTSNRKLTEQARFANEAQRLQEALNLTDAEKISRTNQLQNMLEQQGFQNYLAERGLNMEDFFRTAQMDLSNRQFNWGTQMDWANVFGEWNAGLPSWFRGVMPNGTVLNNYMKNGGGF
jgi:hypothetical protein